MTESRELGPEMLAEGWRVLIDELLVWTHVPSLQSVSVDGCKRKNAVMPAFPNEPASPDADGYLVCQRAHDEQGNPIDGSGVWVESYALAIKTARELRQRIMNDHPILSPLGQLNFDDFLAMKGAKR